MSSGTAAGADGSAGSGSSPDWLTNLTFCDIGIHRQLGEAKRFMEFLVLMVRPAMQVLWLDLFHLPCFRFSFLLLLSWNSTRNCPETRLEISCKFSMLLKLSISPWRCSKHETLSCWADIHQRKFRSLYFRLTELWKSLHWLSLQWLSLQRKLTAMKVPAMTVADITWQCQLAVIEGRLARKRRFHNFNFQYLRDVSHGRFVFTSSNYPSCLNEIIWGGATHQNHFSK